MNNSHKITLLSLSLLILVLCGCKRDPSQEAAYIDIGEGNEILFSAELGTKDVGVKTNVSTLAAKSSEPWLSARVGRGSITVSVTANTDKAPRTGKILVSGEGASATISVRQEGLEPSILVSPETSTVTADAQSLSLSIQANVDYLLPDLGETPWITITSKDQSKKPHQIILSIAANATMAERSATLAFRSKDVSPEIIREVVITQTAPTDYSGEGGSAIGSDEKITVVSGSASSYQGGGEIEKSFDGDMGTIYHSKWDNSSTSYFPITLEYHFAGAETVDYLVYHPRQTGSNGHFKEVELWVKKSDGDLKKQGDYDFKGTGEPKKVDFSPALVGVTAFRFVVKSGAGDGQGFASCAEMEFYRRNKDNAVPTNIFTDGTASALRAGVTEEQIRAISNPLYREIALFIYNKKYPSEFRIQDYRAWPHPNDWIKKSKTNPQNLLDNATGIVAEAGKELIVLVGKTSGHSGLSIKVQNLDRPGGDGYNDGSSTYPLSEGVNKIIPTNGGLIYVLYHTPSYKTAPKIRIHFATGSVNGYFDSEKHSKEDWKRLLAGAKYKYFDVLGKEAHLTFPTEGFRKYAGEDGPELITQYDELVTLETDLMGLKKYDLPRVNRSYFHAMYGSYMYATWYRTAYNVSDENVLKVMCDKETFRKQPWGPAHETGHNYQTRPGFMWAGMTEVTNNVHANYVNVKFGNTSRLSSENRYLSGYNTYHIDLSGLKSRWTRPPYIRAGGIYDTVFEKLVPLWQLYLYFTEVKGQKDFYPDLYEKVRKNPNPPTDEKCLLEFTRLASEISGYDLTDFFEAWSFYTPYKGVVEDYGKKNINLTSSLANEYRAKIVSMGLPKPKEALQYITDKNIDLYRHPKPVVPGTYGRNGLKITITGTTNAVAYEAVMDGRVIALSPDPTFDLPVEAGSATSTLTVRAIAVDGTRTALTAK